MVAGADQTVEVQCNMLLSSVHSKGQHPSDSLFHIFPSPDQLKHQAPPAPPWLENCWVWALVHNNADKDGVVFQVPIGLVLQHSVGDKSGHPLATFISEVGRWKLDEFGSGWK